MVVVVVVVIMIVVVVVMRCSCSSDHDCVCCGVVCGSCSVGSREHDCGGGGDEMSVVVMLMHGAGDECGGDADA